jgi:TDG/mug DNA glycosylase family protein
MASLRDCIGPDPRVLFVGINPGTRSAAIGHHFAGYSNRFWRLLYDSRLVPEPITCLEDCRLPEWGYGITNLVPRSTPGIDMLRPEEFERGRGRLLKKIHEHKPHIVALVGVTVYRALFRPAAGESVLGLRSERLNGVPVFVLPNPSGRNANFTYPEMLMWYTKLRTLLRRKPQKHRDKIKLSKLEKRSC